jgi:hypothetical protein
MDSYPIQGRLNRLKEDSKTTKTDGNRRITDSRWWSTGGWMWATADDLQLPPTVDTWPSANAPLAGDHRWLHTAGG